MRSGDSSSNFMRLFWCVFFCLIAYIAYAAFKSKNIAPTAVSITNVQAVREAASNLSTIPADRALPQGVHTSYFGGFDSARKQRITEANSCVGEPAFVLGCKVSAMLLLEALQFEQLPIPKFWMKGKTTADCEIEMNFKFDKLAHEYPKTTTRHAIDFMNRNHRFIELDKCGSLDKSGRMSAVLSASERLTQAIISLKMGATISAVDQAQISKDWEYIILTEDDGIYRWRINSRYYERSQEYKALLQTTGR
jgi:hypothetical protein